MENMKIGNACIFVDGKGKEHNALVLWNWTYCLNIIYVDVDEEKVKANSSGSGVAVETSVPYYEEGMRGFYIKDNHPTVASQPAIEDGRADRCSCKDQIGYEYCGNCGGKVE